LAERADEHPGIGEVTAVTWALEIGDPRRFSSIADAASYCGLTWALNFSADKAATWADLQTAQWALTDGVDRGEMGTAMEPVVHERELALGKRNRATLAVARKLVAYLLVVDKSGKSFQIRTSAIGQQEVKTAV
jgi:transposase